MDEGLLGFARLAARLKRLRRQGWIDRGVDDPESGADHSWSVALLAWLLAADRPELDRERVLLLGLVHDLPEALAGDATPFDPHRDAEGLICPERFSEPPQYDRDYRYQKRAQEAAALEEMLRDLSSGLASDIRNAWRDYDRGQTLEARFVRQIDKLETLIQAEIYKAGQPDIMIESFRLGARRDVTDPDLRRIVETLIERGWEDLGNE